jgi:hypothetical protein
MPKSRWLVSAPTSSDVRDVCYEGDSGLLNVIPPSLVETYKSSAFDLAEVFKPTSQDKIEEALYGESQDDGKKPAVAGKFGKSSSKQELSDDLDF